MSDQQDQIHAVGDRPLSKRAIFNNHVIEWLSGDVPANSVKATVAASLITTLNGKEDTLASWGMIGAATWLGFSIYDAMKRSHQAQKDIHALLDTDANEAPKRKISM